MSWVRLDDSFLDHPKFVALDATSLRVWLRVLCHCNRHRTGGFASDEIVGRLGGTNIVRSKLTTAPPGYSSGLWDSAVGGIRIHDYETFQPGSSELSPSLRQARAEAGRRGGRASGEARRSLTVHSDDHSSSNTSESNGVTEAILLEAPKQRVEPPTRPDPSRPVPIEEPPPTGVVQEGSRRRGKTLVHPDWKPSSKVVEWARKRGWDALHTDTLEDFIDYWTREGKPMLDWDATYRGRLRYLAEQGRAPKLADPGFVGAPPGDDVGPPTDEQRHILSTLGRGNRDLFEVKPK